jgi:CRISPR/Cas system-associated exonuclease Cas4 (RecB family)
MIGERLKERLNEQVIRKRRENRKKREYLYASDVFGCKRKIVLEARGLEGSDEHAPLLRTFDNGNDIHDRITQNLAELGVLKSKEQDIPRDELNVHGRYDGLLEDEDGEAVLEIKSINMRDVKTPMKHHRAQLQWYMHKTGVPRGVLLYQSKQNGELFPFDEEPDEALLQEARAWFESANEHVAQNKLPPIDPSYKQDKYPCEGCRYNKLCYQLPSWSTQRVHRSSGIVEHVCKHGIGHPTRESATIVAERTGQDVTSWLMHGCDGCCSQPREGDDE